MSVVHSVPNLIREGRLEEAVWRTETALLDFRLEAEQALEYIPFEALLQSPPLLKAFGIRRFMEGRLSDAERALEPAVKGFAKLSCVEQLISAMSILAVVQLQMGRRDEAETMLQFLWAEYTRGETSADGWLPLALALGSRASGEEEHSTALYEASWELFSAAQDMQSSAYVLWETLLTTGMKLGPEAWERWVLRSRRLGGGLAAHAAYAQIITSLRCFHEERWADAAAVWETVSPPVCGYRHRILLEIHMLQTFLYIEKAWSSDRTSWVNDIAAEEKDDLELRFRAMQVLFLKCCRSGALEDGKGLIDRAKAIQSELRIPLLDKAIAVMDKQWSEAVKCKFQDAPNPAQGWRVRCFGGLQFNRAGIEIGSMRWKRKKAQELLIYLLLQPQYSAVKEVAADALFPDTDPDKLGNQWYVVIHQLKQVLKAYLGAENGLLTKERSIRLNPDLIEQVDIEKYTTLVKVANELWLTDRDIAAELYAEAEQLHGEPVPELQYADWLEAIKESLLEKQCGVLKKLAAYAFSRCDYERAEYYLKKWIGLRPFLEEAYQELLKLLIALNRRAEARDWYRRLERSLLSEFNVGPALETKRILSK